MANTAMTAGKQTGSLINHLYSGMVGCPAPEVGMGATVLGWTDRKAGTIIFVEGDFFVVQLDKVNRTDGLGMTESQSYAYEPDTKGPSYTFRKVARGKAKGAWRENGSKDGHGVLIGRRDHYFDFSF
jgi:hypothetical protein